MSYKKMKQIEERCQFDTDAKIRILGKSDFKCCRCGTKIGVSQCTVDHVIPLSKGGVNSDKNLVALCFNCNSLKADSILNPRNYYKYLKPDYMNELMDQFKEFYSNGAWFSPKRIFPEDIFAIEVPIFHASYNMGHMKQNSKKVKLLYRTLKVERVTYNLLQEVYEYICKVYPDNTKDEVKSYLSELYDQGVIYTVKTSQNELLSIHSFRLFMYDEVEEALLITLPVISKKRKDHTELVSEYLEYLLSWLVNLIGAKSVPLFLHDFRYDGCSEMTLDPITFMTRNKSYRFRPTVVMADEFKVYENADKEMWHYSVKEFYKFIKEEFYV